MTDGLGFVSDNYILHTVKNAKLHRITNVDTLSFGSYPENLKEIEIAGVYKCVREDISASLVTAQMAHADTVIHLSAERHVNRSISEPKTFLHSIDQGVFSCW